LLTVLTHEIIFTPVIKAASVFIDAETHRVLVIVPGASADSKETSAYADVPGLLSDFFFSGLVIPRRSAEWSFPWKKLVQEDFWYKSQLQGGTR
jgi:hypothetical protein